MNNAEWLTWGLDAESDVIEMLLAEGRAHFSKPGAHEWTYTGKRLRLHEPRFAYFKRMYKILTKPKHTGKGDFTVVGAIDAKELSQRMSLLLVRGKDFYVADMFFGYQGKNPNGSPRVAFSFSIHPISTLDYVQLFLGLPVERPERNA
jgi:hypothetical protein